MPRSVDESLMFCFFFLKFFLRVRMILLRDCDSHENEKLYSLTELQPSSPFQMSLRSPIGKCEACGKGGAIIAVACNNVADRSALFVRDNAERGEFHPQCSSSFSRSCKHTHSGSDYVAVFSPGQTLLQRYKYLCVVTIC